MDDIARHARLGDALPMVDVVHLMDDTIPELAPAVSELKALEVFAANTTTAYHCAPGTLAATRHWIEVARIMAGGDLAARPILAAYVPSVSPLTLTELNVAQLRLFIESGVPCNVGPCAMAGGTAPWPVAGLVAQSWAEFLAMLVASQVVRPGSAVLGGGGGAHYLDMKSMHSMYSGVSKALAAAAMNELCETFDLPVHSGGFTTLCSNYGVQNGVESTLAALTTFFSRINICGGLGSLANACGMSATQVVLHHDLVEMTERVRRGIDVTGEKLAVGSIVSAGPRGSFLEDRLTLDYLRSDEHFCPSSFEQCAGTRDEKTMAQRACERAEELIATHQPEVPQDRLEDVQRYVAAELAALE
jgi:trimethylamine:corrinoid methyltransferase-like protein